MSVTLIEMGSTRYVIDDAAKAVFIFENNVLRPTGGSFEATAPYIIKNATNSTVLDPVTIDEIKEHGFNQALLKKATGVA